jgi:hypothetical protein
MYGVYLSHVRRLTESTYELGERLNQTVTVSSGGGEDYAKTGQDTKEPTIALNALAETLKHTNISLIPIPPPTFFSRCCSLQPYYKLIVTVFSLVGFASHGVSASPTPTTTSTSAGI